VPGHALRHFDVAAIGEVVCNPVGAEGVRPYRGLNPGVGVGAPCARRPRGA
jgi:hypothetical protein